MKSAINIIKEQISNFYLVRRLSLYEIKSANRNNYLGLSWELINPSIQLVIYWFVFSTIRNRAPIDVNGQEIPFFGWLLAAFFLWTFCSQSILEGSKSIYTRIRMLSKMNFPMSIIPSFVIFSKLYIHFILLALSIILLNIMGYPISIYYLQFVYYIFAAYCLMFSISLITSTLSTIVRDVHMILNSVLRMLFYLSGVLWPITLLSDFPLLMKIMSLNPLYYLFEGYRATFFGVEWHFIAQWEKTLLFWLIVLVLFLIGSWLHNRFRRHLIDYL